MPIDGGGAAAFTGNAAAFKTMGIYVLLVLAPSHILESITEDI
jgi:hypothetical protein